MVEYDDEEFENFNVDELAQEIEKEDAGIVNPELQIKQKEEKISGNSDVNRETQETSNEPADEKETTKEVEGEVAASSDPDGNQIIKNPVFALKCTANREDTVAEFLAANAKRKGLQIFTILLPHGIKNFIFVEALNKYEVDQAAYRVPYARNVLPVPISEKEVLQLISTDKKEVDIRKGDIVEVVAGPFKKEQAKITRVDLFKEEVVIELLDAAVPIPMTRRIEDIRVIRRD